MKSILLISTLFEHKLVTIGDNCLNYLTYQPQTCLILLWNAYFVQLQELISQANSIQPVVNPYTVK